MIATKRGLPKWIRTLATLLLSWIPERMLSALLPAAVGFDPRQALSPVAAPDAPVRLFIGRTNSAGQGWQWARAAERNLDGVGAVSMMTVDSDVFQFPVDEPVPLGVYRWSRSWQKEQEAVIEDAFSHVIIEACKRLFGDVFPGSVASEVHRLRASGVKVAMLCHGSDIRLPSRHAAANQWSPFSEGLWSVTPTLELIASRNAHLLENLGAQVFVSTPDLLLDVPSATWLPVVVDLEAWKSDTAPFSHDGLPRVAHVPSKAIVKGSDLIDPILTRLDAEGLLHYERVHGVPAAEMPAIYAGVDIVLDQFRLGSYGVAACEAMASGRVVVSHVGDQVRGYVEEAVGQKLPIVEANVDTLESVLRGIIAKPAAWSGHPAAGVEFVRSAHDGRLSAEALRAFLH